MLNINIRKYYSVILCFLLLCSFNNLFSQIWAKSFRSTTDNDDNGRCIARDASGNIYVGGGFRTTVDFDPDGGTYNLTADNTYATNVALFFAKYTSAGALVWAKRVVGTGTTDQNIVYGITVDASENVYITGVFQGTADFDPGAGTANLTSAGSNDIFFAKYDNSGNYVWAKKVGGANSDYGNAICLDASSNIYIVGYYTGATVDFDPGAGTANLTNSGSSDVFFAKYDNNGNYVWAKKIGGANTDNGNSIKVDVSSSNIFICGSFGSLANVDFDPGAGTYNLATAGNSDADAFVAKYDCAAGAFQWAFKIGSGTDANDDEEALGISLDGSDNVYVIGSMAFSTIDFDPSGSTANISKIGTRDCFFAKYDASGNYVWAKNIGGATYSVHGLGLYVESPNVYLVGDFTGTVDFDPDVGTENRTAVASIDMFFSEYSTTNGSFVCKGSIGGTSIDYAAAVVGDGSGGSFYIIGWFRGTNVNFDPVYGSTLLTSGVSGTSSDIFFGSYLLKPGGPGCIIGLPVELINYNTVLKKNIVEITWQTASELNNDFFSLERSYDGINYEYITKIDGAGNSNSILNYYFEDISVDFNKTTVYYKLNQYDFDGKSNSYISVINLLNEFEKDKILFVTQTDINDYFQVIINSSKNGTAKIQILSCNGDIISKHTFLINQGINELNYSKQNFVSGLYIMNLQIHNISENRKFIICN